MIHNNFMKCNPHTDNGDVDDDKTASITFSLYREKVRDVTIAHVSDVRALKYATWSMCVGVCLYIYYETGSGWKEWSGV